MKSFSELLGYLKSISNASLESSPPRPIVPDDKEGRSWVEMAANGSTGPEQSAIVTLIAADEDNKIEILGSAFVIRANEDNAICIGAAHSFEPVKQRQAWRKGHRPQHIPIDFLPKGPEFFDTDEIHAMAIRGEAVHVCRVGQINYLGNLDAAVFSVHAPAGEDIFKGHLAIDLGAPNVGDVVSVMAHEMEIDHRGDGQGVLKQAFRVRCGVVTSVDMGKSPMPGLSACFGTTIPIYGGMSGSPVLRGLPGEKGSAIVAIGLVSTDHSEEEAFKKFHVPGQSTMTMLWPAMGLALDVGIEADGTSRSMF